MATITADRAATTFPVFKPLGSGTKATAYGTYSLTANPTVADIYEMCRLPAGAVVVGGEFWASDMDTNVTPTLDIDIGWASNGTEAADSDGFVNSGVLSGDAITGLKAAGSNFRPFVMSGGPFTFTAETVVTATIVAAAATFAAGTLYVRVDYVVP